MALNREQFLAGRKLKTFEIEVPELGTVKLKELSETERVQKFDLWVRPGDKPSKTRQADSRLKIVTLCVVGDDDKPFLSDADFPVLRAWPAGAITQIVEVAMKCCGLSDDDIDDKLKKTSSDSAEQEPQTIVAGST